MGKLKELIDMADGLIKGKENHQNLIEFGKGMKHVLDELSKESYVNKIDWSELRNQKRTLLETINYVDEVDIEIGEREPIDTVNYLTGILHLIDALQDFAVDELEVNPIHVYDFEDEEGRDD